MQDFTIINHIQLLTGYGTSIVAFLVCLVLFIRTRKIGFLFVAIVSLAYLLPELWFRLASVPSHTRMMAFQGSIIVLNVAQIIAWVVLAVEFLSGRNRTSPAAATIAAPRAPACANCNTPLDPASRFCAKCGHATGT